MAQDARGKGKKTVPKASKTKVIIFHLMHCFHGPFFSQILFLLHDYLSLSSSVSFASIICIVVVPGTPVMNQDPLDENYKYKTKKQKVPALNHKP